MKWFILIIGTCTVMTFTKATIPIEDTYSPISEIKCTSEFKGNVGTCEVKYLSRKYGASVWLNLSSNQIKAKYLANKGNYNNIFLRYNDWQSNKECLLETTGGLTTQDYLRPIGLTIDNGKVINQKIEKKMDALVILKQGNIEVHNLEKTFKYNEKPFNFSYGAREVSSFTNLAKRHKIATFQTHLLAHKNQLKVTVLARKKMSKRKFLVLLNHKNGEKYGVIFYIKKGEYLYDAAKKIFNYLQHQEHDLTAMINLDTGTHNVLEVNQKLKQCNGDILEGTQNIKEATNLFSFYLN